MFPGITHVCIWLTWYAAGLLSRVDRVMTTATEKTLSAFSTSTGGLWGQHGCLKVLCLRVVPPGHAGTEAAEIVEAAVVLAEVLLVVQDGRIVGSLFLPVCMPLV